MPFNGADPRAPNGAFDGRKTLAKPLADPWVVMVQVTNHATEHRAQIDSRLSALGVTPRELDGWNYALATKALSPGSIQRQRQVLAMQQVSIPCSPNRTERKSTGKSDQMKQSIVHIALVVRDYDEAIQFYTKKLHFTLIEDTYQPEQDKRWVVVSPPGSVGTTLLLARASKPEQEPFVGNQSGGRVFLFLNTDDFWRDYNDMVSQGIKFVRLPKKETYGMVAVFQDLYGNLWDLLELNADHPISRRTP